MEGIREEVSPFLDGKMQEGGAELSACCDPYEAWIGSGCNGQKD